MDFSMYEAQLTRRMWLYGIFCAVFAVGFIICIFVLLHNASSKTEKDLEEKAYNWILLALGFAGLVGCLLLGGTTVWECKYDIDNQAYIVWEGDFFVYQDGPTKSRWYLSDDEETKLEGVDLGEGRYTGKVIYAEISRIVLEYNITHST